MSSALDAARSAQRGAWRPPRERGGSLATADRPIVKGDGADAAYSQNRAVSPRKQAQIGVEGGHVGDAGQGCREADDC